MPSFEQRFYIENPGRAQQVWRNFRLLGVLILAGCVRLSKGLFLRHALRRARKTGTAVILEDHFG